MSSDIDTQIVSARNLARRLYSEVEAAQRKAKDATLADVAANVPPIMKSHSNLKLYNTLKGHRNKVVQIRWNHSSSSLLTACQDGYMLVWDSVSGFKKNAVVLANPWVLTCAYSPSSTMVASGGLDNVCTVYKISDTTLSPYTAGTANPVQARFKGHAAYISDTAFLSDNTVVTASGDSSCALWDVDKSSRVRVFYGHLGDVLFLTTMKNSPTFLSGSSDGYVKVWDPRARAPVRSYFVSSYDVTCAAVHPDNNSFMVGSDDGLIRYYDLRSDCEISTYSMSNNFAQNQPSTPNRHSPTSIAMNQFDNPGVLSFDFTISGRLLYSCYSDFGCIIWDVLKNEIIGTLGNDHMGKINQVKVSPDGMAVATASWDSTVKVWSV